MHAKPMLFIHHRKGEIVKDDVFLEQGVGADQEIDVTEREAIENLLASRPAFAAGKNGDANAGSFGTRRDGPEGLARENFGRRHKRGLPARYDHSGAPA